ncbi:MAG: serine hydrolase [Bacteroidota bacterium]
MTHARYFVFLISICLLNWVGAAAQINRKTDWNDLDAYLRQTQQNWGTPGMVVGIVKNGDLVFCRGYGEKTIGQNTRQQVPFDQPDQNTLFAIASNTKAFTATALALLVQEGKIRWDDPVRKYLPYFTLYDPWVSEAFTIRDLLCHRSGLGTFSGDVLWYRSTLSAPELIKRYHAIEPEFPFRSGYGYSNLMYIAAGELIAVTSGQPYIQFVENRILKPLGMSRSTFQLARLTALGNFAQPHAYKDGEHHPIPWVSWETVAATGGLLSSVADLAKWVEFNIDHGVWKGDTLLSTRLHNHLWTPHNGFQLDHSKPDKSSSFSTYGLGWQLSDYKGHFRAHHTGGYDGMISSIQVFPDLELGIIVLTNGVRAPITAIPNYIVDKILLGRNERDWCEEQLRKQEKRETEDTRIPTRVASRVLGTQPGLSPQQAMGVYRCAMYGDINLTAKNDTMYLTFSHTPSFSCRLSHWHYNTWKIEWNEPQAWFGHATVQIVTDPNNLPIGLAFDVPNDDIFFHEIKAKRVENNQ